MIKSWSRALLSTALVLLVVSATVRMSGGLAKAWAQSGNESLKGKISMVADPTVGCAPLPSGLAAEFSVREANIFAKEIHLDERSAALDVAEQILYGKVEELKMAEENLRATIALSNVAAENDLAKMTAVYEAMKPKDAAALFDSMDVDFSAGFVSRMRPEIAASILAGMTPENAYAVSAVVAGRNANAAKN